MPSSTMEPIASPSKDLKNKLQDLPVATPLCSSGSILDASNPSSGLQLCSSLQFSFQELKTKRQQRLSIFQSSGYKHGRAKMKRFMDWNFIWTREKYDCALFLTGLVCYDN